MSYDKKPKMILFDVGGTLFNDGKCIPADGFEKLRQYAVNPEVTDGKTLEKYWDEFMDDISGVKSKSGTTLDIPLSSVIRYASMNTGLKFEISDEEQEEIFDRFNSERNVLDGVTDLLATLDSLGIRTAVISNNMMSGESLAIAMRKWIPSAKFEFCLSSADILLTKPDKRIFMTALNHAGLEPSDCWYCGDNVIPDVFGSSSCGITPVLIDEKTDIPLEFRSDEKCEKYLTVNNWNHLTDFIKSI